LVLFSYGLQVMARTRNIYRQAQARCGVA
jgi:hypothetical protein